MLIMRKFSPATDDCMVIVNGNEIAFYAKDFPEKKDGIETVVTSVISCGQHLQDIEGADDVTCHRNKIEEVAPGTFFNKIASVKFPEGIPADYQKKLDSYQAEDFIVEYHEECVLEV